MTSAAAQLAHGLFGVFLQEAVAAGGHHDGVKNNWNGRIEAVEELGHHVGNGGVSQHANLYRINGHVIANGVQLLAEKVHRRDMDAAHALGILRHQGGHHGHAISARGGNGLQISLNSRPAGWIGAGNRQDTGVGAARHKVVHNYPFASAN